MSYFLHPYRVACEVPAYALILVVGVHFACLLVDVPLLIATAAAANVLAATAKPFGSGTEEVEDMVAAIVADGYNFLSAASGGVGSFCRAVLVEVFPAFTHTALAFLAHPLIEPLALVVGFVTFEESAIVRVDSSPIRGDV